MSTKQLVLRKICSICLFRKVLKRYSFNNLKINIKKGEGCNVWLLRELIINSIILLLICQIHDTLVSRLAQQSNWFILQTLKITITYEALLIKTTFMSLLQPGFLPKESLDHSFNTQNIIFSLTVPTFTIPHHPTDCFHMLKTWGKQH